MSELLKSKYYNYETLNELALRIQAVYPSFQIDNFISDIMDEAWESLELKARMRKITITLGKHLPSNYAQALGIIDNVVASFPTGFNDNALIYFPDFVEVYGRNSCDWELSIAALERYTQSSTAEFAVRPFIMEEEGRMMRQMAIWAKHENEHVRRLASEGCRPALPWGQALTSFKKDPSPILVILEQLKTDPSLYVRKSVANNLNDISKTHPELVTGIAENWYGENDYTDWIVKHGCRTLLKKGDSTVLKIFGFAHNENTIVKDLSLITKSVHIGEKLAFQFVISAKEATKVRIEYGIDYLKKNGGQSRKIFQIAEIFLQADQEKSFKKTHSFEKMSTRTLYPGVHSVALIVNGIELGHLDFDLIATR